MHPYLISTPLLSGGDEGLSDEDEGKFIILIAPSGHDKLAVITAGPEAPHIGCNVL